MNRQHDWQTGGNQVWVMLQVADFDLPASLLPAVVKVEKASVRNSYTTSSLSRWVRARAGNWHSHIWWEDRGRTTRLVERWTKPPGAVLGFDSLLWQGIFPPSQFFSADSCVVCTALIYEITCINICVHSKNPKHWQLYYCVDAQKYSTHCSAALVKKPKFPTDRGGLIKF